VIPHQILKEYNLVRKCRDRSVVCHAPFTNIRFYQGGDAAVCALNAVHILGTYPRDSIRDMWLGARAAELREAMRSNDLSLGCAWCAHELMSRNFTGAKSTFDRYADGKDAGKWAALLFRRVKRHFVPRPEPKLPKSMELSLSNTCNLECVMCRGFFSSAIQHKRGGPSPMSNPYDMAFVEQLEEFIPSLSIAHFQGGEPFLIGINYDIWDRVHRLNPNLDVHITTNATILNDHVKAVLESLNCHLILSVDSLHKETYEAIRRNASYEQVMRNMDYFMTYSAAHGRTLTLAVCLMPRNWREIPHIVEYCSRRHIVIWFNTVYSPLQFSLRAMSAPELTRIADTWSTLALPVNDWVTVTNRDRFASAISQIRQWRDEALRREEIHDAAGWSQQQTMDGISEAGENPVEEMSRVFVEVMSSDSPSKQHVPGNSTSDDEPGARLKEYLYRKLLKLSEEPFLQCYFSALREAYSIVHGTSPRAKKNELLEKMDRLHNELARHYARDAFIMVLAEADVRDILSWIGENPPEMLRRLLIDKAAR